MAADTFSNYGASQVYGGTFSSTSTVLGMQPGTGITFPTTGPSMVQLGTNLLRFYPLNLQVAQ